MTSPLDCEPLLEALSREIGQFEGRVAILEEKCGQIRACIHGLVEEFRETRGSAKLPEDRGQAEDRLSLAHVAELCGMKNHVELARKTGNPDDNCIEMVVHEPDGGIITVDGFLGGCRLDDGKLLEEVRNRIAHLCSRQKQERGGNVSGILLIYVPVELDVSACFAGHEQILEDAQGQRIVVAPPSALFSVLKNTAVRWLSFTCGRSARAIVDRGQDLVDELSAFIGDFTESEKLLCSLVDDCAQAARRRKQTFASQRG